jgi:hypothetical protein
MNDREIGQRRLLSQGLSGVPFTTIDQVVGWLGAVQSQEYPVAKWSVGQRARGLRDADLDRALADGTVLRTHVLRPTWHFVRPADIRWMLELTAPRIRAMNAHYHRRLGLDDALVSASNAALARILSGGGQLTRRQLAAAVEGDGIPTDTMRLSFLLMRAELDAVICSGGLTGKQRTYALLDERVPPAPPVPRDQALAELTRRYFTSHGPATVPDFVWWSSLTVADARRGVELLGAELEPVVAGDRTYWSAAAPAPGRPDPSPTAHLLQGFDEYVVGYRGGRKELDAAGPVDAGAGRVPFPHAVVLDGELVGTWRRSFAPPAMAVEVQPLRALDGAERAAVQSAAVRYGEFVELPVELSVLGPAGA